VARTEPVGPPAHSSQPPAWLIQAILPAVVTSKIPFKPLNVHVFSIEQCRGVIVAAEAGAAWLIMPPIVHTHRTVPATPIKRTMGNRSLLAATSNWPVSGWNRSVVCDHVAAIWSTAEM
jgi:hypothetical protein